MWSLGVVSGCGQWVVDNFLPYNEVALFLLSLCVLAASSLLSVQFLYIFSFLF